MQMSGGMPLAATVLSFAQDWQLRSPRDDATCARITAVMRRLFSTLLAVAFLANVAVWPSAALAEVLEHQQEQVQLTDPAGTPAEPQAVHCHHGCASHCGQHFQGQPGTPALAMRDCGTERPTPIARPLVLQHNPALPFRPPLAAPIQS